RTAWIASVWAGANAALVCWARRPTVPRDSGTSRTSSANSSRPRWLRWWRPVRKEKVAASRGLTQWSLSSAGVAAWLRVPQPGQVRKWPRYSVTSAAVLGNSATWCQVGSGSSGGGSEGRGSWQRWQWLGTKSGMCWTRSGGERRRRWAGCPGWPPVLRPEGFLGGGLGASGGLAEACSE